MKLEKIPFIKKSIATLFGILILFAVQAQDTIPIQQLPEVSVLAKVKIDTLTDTKYSVVDYVFIEDVILLMVYENAFRKYELLILDQTLQEKHRLSLQDKRPVKLFESCFGGTYLITETHAYQISLDTMGIHLKKAIESTLFEELVNPCVWSTDNFMYFSKYYFQGQALEYQAISQSENRSPHTLPLIQDENNIALLIEETGQRMPRSGDVWQTNVSDGVEELRDLDYRLRGMMKIFYPKVYAPIYGRDSTLCLFNHPASVIQFYSESGKHLQEVPIDYHRKEKWKKEVLYDQKNGKSYTTFDTRWGETIHRINIEKGTIGSAISIDRPFIKMKKVRDGFLYFLYHDPYLYHQNRTLQRLSID